MADLQNLSPNDYIRFDYQFLMNLITTIKNKFPLRTEVDLEKLSNLKETDNYTIGFDGTVTRSQYAAGTKYWTKDPNANNAHSVSQEKVIDALNQLTDYLKQQMDNIDVSAAYNGELTQGQDGTYTGTGNAVTAAKVATVINVLKALIDGKIDIDDVSQASSDINATNTNPVAGKAVYSYVQDAISGVTGLNFYICQSGQYSGNSQTFTVDGATTTLVLTDSPKAVRRVTINGTSTSDYTYAAATHTVTLTEAPGTSGTNVTIIVYYIPYPIISTPSTSTIYLVPNDGTGSNVYNEYVYINNNFELIGSTEFDLSDYVKQSDLVVLTRTDIETLFTATPNS